MAIGPVQPSSSRSSIDLVPISQDWRIRDARWIVGGGQDDPVPRSGLTTGGAPLLSDEPHDRSPAVPGWRPLGSIANGSRGRRCGGALLVDQCAPWGPRPLPRHRGAGLGSFPASAGELHRRLLAAQRRLDGQMGPRRPVEGGFSDRLGCGRARDRYGTGVARSSCPRRRRQPGDPHRCRRPDDGSDRVSAVGGGVRGRGTHRHRWTVGGVMLGSVEVCLGAVLFLARDADAPAVRITIGVWGLVAGILLLVQGVRMLHVRRAMG